MFFVHFLVLLCSSKMGPHGIISVRLAGLPRITMIRNTRDEFLREFAGYHLDESPNAEIHLKVASRLHDEVMRALREVAPALVIEEGEGDPRLRILLRENSAKIASPIQDVQGDARWTSIFERHVEASRRTPAFQLLLLGDSLVQQMELSETWANLDRFSPLNFGIGGDEVQHALWRFKNAGFGHDGEASGEATLGAGGGGREGKPGPKACVLLVGTNNHRHTASETAEGIITLARTIQSTWPATTVVLIVSISLSSVFVVLL